MGMRWETRDELREKLGDNDNFSTKEWLGEYFHYTVGLFHNQSCWSARHNYWLKEGITKGTEKNVSIIKLAWMCYHSFVFAFVGRRACLKVHQFIETS